MDHHLQLEILTPERKVLSESVSECTFPTAEQGYYGILPGHTPMVTALGSGLITYVQDKKTHVLALFGGFAEVGPDHVTLLARQCENPSAYKREDLEAQQRELQQALKEAKEPESLQATQQRLHELEIRLAALNH